MTFGPAGQVIHITFESVEVRFQYPHVAIVLIHRPGNDQIGTVPGGTIAPGVTPAAGGNDTGKFTGIFLLILAVHHPLGVSGPVEPVKHGLIHGDLGIACPAVFLTVRAIGRDADIVAPICPQGTVVDFVNQVIGTFELADLVKCGMDDPTGNRVERRDSGEAGEFDILIPIIGKPRLPCFGSLATENIRIRMKHIFIDMFLDFLLVEGAIFVESFAIAHLDFGAGGAGDLELCPARDVLAEVEDIRTGFG